MQEPIQSATQWQAVLANMSTDRRFREIARDLWQARIDDAKVGVSLAKRPKNRDSYLLNVAGFDRLIKAKRGLIANKSLDFAFVVAVNKVGFANVFVGYRDAEELYEILMDVPPIKGRFGAFWLLKSDLTPAFIDSTDDDLEEYM
jgi:hypothetical protein